MKTQTHLIGEVEHSTSMILTGSELIDPRKGDNDV